MKKPKIAYRVLSALVCLAMLASFQPPQTSVRAAGMISLFTPGSAYTQDFNSLSNVAGSTTNDLSINGWFMTESGGGARDNELYAVDTGSSTTGDTYSYGAAGDFDRALGALQSGTLIPLYGAFFYNVTGAAINALTVQYTGEQWRLGTAGRTDQINFEYSTDATSLTTGTWTGVSSLNFVTPDTTTVGAKNGNASTNRTSISYQITGLNIPNNTTFWIRWTDTNAAGADDGLAVDDFSLTPQALDAAPYVSSTAPANGASGQAANTDLSIIFSEPVDVAGNWLQINCSASGLRNVFDTQVTGGPVSFTINPNADFTAGESCTVTVFAAGVTDQDADDPPDTMATNYSFTFSIDAAPTVASSTPANSATGVALNADIAVNFSEAVDVGTASFTITGGSSGAHSFTVGGSGTSSITLNPGADFVANETVTVSVVAVQVSDSDLADPPDKMPADYTFSFTTGDAAPYVTSTTPAAGASNVATTANILINFSEPVNYSSNPIFPFSVAGSLSGNHDYSVFTTPIYANIDPVTDFTPGETVTVTVFASQITDQDSDDPPDNLAADAVFTFTVDSPPSNTGVVVTPGTGGIAVTSNIVVKFDEPVTATNSSFTFASPSGPFPFITSGSGTTNITVDPTGTLAYSTWYTLTLVADQISDVDAGDPPDHPASDTVLHFLTETNPCTQPYTTTSRIQGSGPVAAITGVVTTQGVVVGDYEGASPALRGFFIQDQTGDGDPATSDGIFVFNGNNNSVSLGELVRVTGTAGENQGQTQVSASSVLKCGPGSVNPTDVSFPAPDSSYLERYEGMLVRLPQTMVVTEMYLLGRFGQVTLSPNARLQQPTNVVLPGAPAAALQAANDLNQVILDDELNNQNPDPIRFGRGGLPLSASNTLRGGDTATNIVGVMNYTWAGNAASPNAWRVRPVNALNGSATFMAANPRPVAVPALGGNVKVVGMNLLNYFNTFADNNVNTPGCYPSGTDGDCRGANSQAEFDRQWPKTVAAILATGADVIEINEIENDGYGPNSAIQDLVNRLNAASAPGTYAFIDVDTATGQTLAMGTDGIKVGMLYKPAAVTPVGVTAPLNSTAFVNGGDGAPRNRVSLAQAFKLNLNGEVFIVNGNHLKSKGSACDLPDQNDGQGNCNQVRVNAVNQLVSWFATNPTGTGDPDILMVGDYNAYAKEDPITTLEGAGFTNLIASRLGPDAYSYVFNGQWGYLDHALASASLNTQVAGVGDYHINADEPSVLDYNMEFKSAGQIASLYAPDQFRMSDHDPVVIGLALKAPSTTAVKSSLSPSIFGQSVTFTATVTATAGIPTGTVDFSAGGSPLCSGVSLVNGVAACTPAPPLAVGSYTIKASYSGDNNYQASAGDAGQQVDGIPMFVSLVSAPNPQYTNASVTLTATVSLSNPTGLQPTPPPPACPFGGTVTFKEGAQVLGSAVLDAACQAVLTTSWAEQGPHTVIAAYEGDTTHAPAISTTLVQQIWGRFFFPVVAKAQAGWIFP